MEWRCRGEYERSFLNEFQEVSGVSVARAMIQWQSMCFQYSRSQVDSLALPVITSYTVCVWKDLLYKKPCGPGKLL